MPSAVVCMCCCSNLLCERVMTLHSLLISVRYMKLFENEFECTQPRHDWAQCFSHVGPSSGIQC